VKRARFVAAARREFLAEVAYYAREEAGLGARFTAAVAHHLRRPEYWQSRVQDR